MELVQAVAQVPKSENVGDRPFYEVHINSITLEGYVTSETEETEESSIPNINFSLSILSIGLLAVLRRK
jgi:hypothetical protein